jgi:hypothetical protein
MGWRGSLEENMTKVALHGKPRSASLADYTGADEYKDQGDTRVVRVLRFSYLAQYIDIAGLTVLEPVDVERGTELAVDEMGLIALEKGERLHAFYTSDERKVLEAGGNPDRPAALSEEGVSAMGEFELAEYIGGNNPSGKALKADEVVELAGTDKDLAHRLLQAENIASDGDPRKTVEAGLTAIIEQG